jgi:hypothetical protein
MASIQILELPTQSVGEVYRTPFAIVIDQVESETLDAIGGENIRTDYEFTQTEADAMAKNIGAVGAVLTARTLDVA